ncbi:ATP phosphoribosyltransferase regulatory subunit (plasmid) [Streptomyces sp. BI20]|uniref:ATP phosphoribosyltransferase regulatory subunit n=1 Tax=Streptomyces sp. BI20 TaxID=3403460 RepID=UPI003C73B4E0
MTTTQPVAGTRDRHGAELRRRDYVSDTLRHLAYSRGFEPLAVPILEAADSFSETVVGRSPWPEWNPAGVFEVVVEDYTAGYRHRCGTRAAVLVPEGTVSVARWIAGRLAEHGPAALPAKICYDLPCHRNEPVDALSTAGGKLREFSQFGIEVIGAHTPAADAEVIVFVRDALAALGIGEDAIRIRINDVAGFRRLAAASALDHDQAVTVKEHLDALAECRAGKNPARAPDLHKTLSAALDEYEVPARLRPAWQLLASHDTGRVDHRVRRILGADHAPTLDGLEDLRTRLTEAGVHVRVDLGVVRSHEYYTGVSFEVDVVHDTVVHAEIAGGGRYDKLIGHFTTPDIVPGPATVPATGFAFGVERLTLFLERTGLFDRPTTATRQYRFSPAPADVLAVPRHDPGTVDAFLRAHRGADRRLRRVDVWLDRDNDPETVGAYAAARGITEVTWC